ncbi:MAG: aldehyde dehydrogenase family protein [Akkermansiaceae bacterium]
MLDEFGEAVERARRFFRAGGCRGLEDRRKVLERLESVLVSKRDDLLAALAEDLGKPGMEAYLSEYHFLLQELRLVRKNLKKWLRRKRVGSPIYFWPCRSWLDREPFGVVLVIAPWNYPFQLSLSPVISAIAAGNSVVLKPSELAPASERVLREIIEEAFDRGRAEVVTGGVVVAEALLGQKFDFIFFTGSTGVGRKVAMKAAESLTPTLMELGGKCPCVVDKGVDLKVAARRVLAGKFFNGGQTCFAPDFVAVSEAVQEDFSNACEETLKEVPWAEEMASMISSGHAERVKRLCEGEVKVFGDDDDDRNFLAPRLILNAGWDHPALQEEIFGPVLPIVGYSDQNELVGRLAKMANPLAIYCFSKRKEFVDAVTYALPSGSLCLNDTMKQFSQLELPLGGVGDSGYGRYRGRFGVEAFSYEKSVTKRYFFLKKDYSEMLPPYERAYHWVRKFLR